MYRTFIATVTAAAIALTAVGTTSASAGSRDTNRAIATVLGLAAVGAIIHKKNKDKKRQSNSHQRSNTHQRSNKVFKQARPHQQHRANPPRYQAHRSSPQRVNRKLLPQHCFQSFETHRGKVRMFPSRCLQRNFSHANSLPQSCEYIFNTSRGDRRGYEARCLKDNGYRLARG